MSFSLNVPQINLSFQCGAATHLRLQPLSIAATLTVRQPLVVGDVVIDTQPMVQSREGAGAAGRRIFHGQRRRAKTAAVVSGPIAVETPGPPVDGVVNNGMFVCEGGGKGPWFVSMGDLEDQTLMAAAAVNLVPVILD